jgi:hypothetical protein
VTPSLNQVAVNDKSKVSNVYSPDLDFEDSAGDGLVTKRSIASEGRLEDIREVKEAHFDLEGGPFAEDSVPGIVDGKKHYRVGQKDEVDFQGNDTSKQEIIMTNTPEFNAKKFQRPLAANSSPTPRKGLLAKPEPKPKPPTDPSYFVKEPAYFRKFQNNPINSITKPPASNPNPPQKQITTKVKPVGAKRDIQNMILQKKIAASLATQKKNTTNPDTKKSPQTDLNGKIIWERAFVFWEEFNSD